MTSPHEGLSAMTEMPLLEAMQGRRSRRFGRGMSIPDGPLAYKSDLPPTPLDALERAVLVLSSTGISGWTSGIEHTTAGDPDFGCNYAVRLPGRVQPTAAGIGATELLVTDDDGTFITRFRDLDPGDVQKITECKPSELPQVVADNSARLSSSRIHVPRQNPYVSAHNHWNANVPGSTLFVPLVDLSQQLLDFLFIYMGSGYYPWDTVADEPCGNLSRAITDGTLDETKRFSIQEFEQYVFATGATEVGLIAYNGALAMQAMGLGGWMFTGIDPGTLLGSRAAEGLPGAGFDFTHPDGSMAPTCVGIADHFETFSPPWHENMESAVNAFVDRKFGPGGTYDPTTSGPWRSPKIKSRVERYDEGLVHAVATTAEYLYSTYGRFPSTTTTVFTRMYAQAHHVEEEFYDRFYTQDMLLETHRQHDRRWHSFSD